MPIELTDAQITSLVTERKQLPGDYRSRLLNLRPRHSHKSSQLSVVAPSGLGFEIFLRQGMNPLDFSAILGYSLPSTGRIFRLRRYNGKSHSHGNRIEGNIFYDFHIHMATERYQALGSREDSFAETSNRFTNLQMALDCLVKDCGFGDVDQQLSIFSARP